MKIIVALIIVGVIIYFAYMFANGYAPGEEPW